MLCLPSLARTSLVHLNKPLTYLEPQFIRIEIIDCGGDQIR